MKDAIFLIFELLKAIARLLRPGGSRAIIAENVLLVQQPIKPLHKISENYPTHQVIPKIAPETSPALWHINCGIPR
jgi:hypothetical protein